MWQKFVKWFGSTQMLMWFLSLHLHSLLVLAHLDIVVVVIVVVVGSAVIVMVVVDDPNVTFVIVIFIFKPHSWFLHGSGFVCLKKNKETPCCEMSLNCCSGGLIDRDNVSTCGGNCRRVSSGGLGRSFIVFIKSDCLYIYSIYIYFILF